MRNFLISTAILFALTLFACGSADNKEATEKRKFESPLLGAWILVQGKYYTPNRDSLIGDIKPSDRPSSIKVFSNGHFAYIFKDEKGLNAAGSAGPYRIEGNKYIETHDWLGATYDQRFLGSTSTYEFKIEGDTLYTTGTIKSVHANGQEIKDHIQMDEVRIRVKEN